MDRNVVDREGVGFGAPQRFSGGGAGIQQAAGFVARGEGPGGAEHVALHDEHNVLVDAVALVRIVVHGTLSC
jgi:hypothetical protein